MSLSNLNNNFNLIKNHNIELIKENKKLKEQIELINSKLQIKISNEQKLILSRDNFKNLLNNNCNINKDIESQNNSLQQKYNNILNENNILFAEMKNISENYQKNLDLLKEKLGNGNYVYLNCESLNDYISLISKELIRLNQEHTGLNELYNIIKEYKNINEELKNTADDYLKQVNNKNSILNNLTFEKNQIEIKYNKLNNDTEFILNIINRVCTIIFDNNNLFILVKKLIENSDEIKENINTKIIDELNRLKQKYWKSNNDFYYENKIDEGNSSNNYITASNLNKNSYNYSHDNSMFINGSDSYGSSRFNCTDGLH